MHTYIGDVHLLEAYFVRFKIKLLFGCFAKAMLLGCNINAFRVQNECFCNVICPILHHDMTQIIVSFQKNNGVSSVTY